MKVGDVVSVYVNDPHAKPIGSVRVQSPATVLKVNYHSAVVKLRSGKIIDRKIVRDFGYTPRAIWEHEQSFKGEMVYG